MLLYFKAVSSLSEDSLEDSSDEENTLAQILTLTLTLTLSLVLILTLVARANPNSHCVARTLTSLILRAA